MVPGFDGQFEEATRIADLGLNVTFRSWMLLSLLGFSPRKWSGLLKTIGRRLSIILAEYREMQGIILRERVLENSVFDFRGTARLRSGGRGSYMVEEDVDPRLFSCACSFVGRRGWLI